MTTGLLKEVPPFSISSRDMAGRLRPGVGFLAVEHATASIQIINKALIVFTTRILTMGV